jgi:hypothetical protein
VEPDAGDGLSVGRKAQEEQRHAMAFFELLAPKRSLEASMTVDALRLVQVDLPQVRPFQGVMTFEADARSLVDETRAVPVPATN